MPNKIWTWIAVLNDSDIRQVNIDGTVTGFNEVLKAEKEGLLKKFFLSNNDNIIGVDLQNGKFYLNGLWLDPLPALKGIKYRVVFYRRHDGILGETDEIFKYLVGWQTTVEGKNYQRIMFLDAKTFEIVIKTVR